MNKVRFHFFSTQRDTIFWHILIFIVLGRLLERRWKVRYHCKSGQEQQRHIWSAKQDIHCHHYPGRSKLDCTCIVLLLHRSYTLWSLQLPLNHLLNHLGACAMQGGAPHIKRSVSPSDTTTDKERVGFQPPTLHSLDYWVYPLCHLKASFSFDDTLLTFVCFTVAHQSEIQENTHNIGEGMLFKFGQQKNLFLTESCCTLPK